MQAPPARSVRRPRTEPPRGESLNRGGRETGIWPQRTGPRSLRPRPRRGRDRGQAQSIHGAQQRGVPPWSRDQRRAISPVARRGRTKQPGPTGLRRVAAAQAPAEALPLHRLCPWRRGEACWAMSPGPPPGWRPSGPRPPHRPALQEMLSHSRRVTGARRLGSGPEGREPRPGSARRKSPSRAPACHWPRPRGTIAVTFHMHGQYAPRGALVAALAARLASGLFPRRSVVAVAARCLVDASFA